MKYIEDVKKVGTKKYTRTLGATFTMQELLEDMEESNYEVIVDGESWCVGNPTLYEINVKGKDVDAKDIVITLYDSEDNLDDEYYSENGDYVTQGDLEELEELEQLSKAELITRVLEMRNN